MNEAIITDLKQFITATVTQATSDMATKDDIAGLGARITGLDQRVTGLDQSMTGLGQRMSALERRFDDFDLKLDTIADAHAETLENHEHRLAKLEQKAA